MNRWIVFDGATAACVEPKTNGRVEVRDPNKETAGIVAMAAASGTAVALVPAGQAGQALLMHFTRNPGRSPQTPEKLSGTHVAPGGFLGLADEIVLEDEPSPPKKWWQKLLD